MKKDPERYFDDVLSDTDFLTEARALNGADAQESFFTDAYGGLFQPKQGAPEDVVVTLECSLEELYNGSIKQVEYSRNVVQHDAKSIKAESNCQQVEIKPGFSSSSELVFKKLGHQSPGHVAANLIVKIKELEHADYRRKGHDLILKHKVSLLDAFECKPCSFSTLDGRRLTIAIDEQISPQSCKLIEDEGMPVEGSDTRGNLYLTFAIEFPTQFALETKQRMLAALERNEEQLAAV